MLRARACIKWPTWRRGIELDQGPSGAPASACPSTCGNGLVEGAEQCDLGQKQNDGTYGGCTAACEFAGFCGDGIVNGPESCDDADNRATYSLVRVPNACAAGCRFASFCGDGQIDSQDGEQCDDGDHDGAGRCSAHCLLGLRK